MFERFLNYLFPSPPRAKEHKRVVPLTSNAKAVLGFGVNNQDIPDELCCAITCELMDNPVLIDSRPDDGTLVIEHEHIIDRSTLEYLSQVPTIHIQDPFTRYPIKTVRELPELKLKIQVYVLTQQILYLCKKNLQPGQHELIYPDNLQRLIEMGINQYEIPEEYFSRHLTQNMLVFPVLINGKYVVEFRDLNEWWEQHRNFPANPCDPSLNPVTSLQFMDELYNRINLYLYQCEHRPIGMDIWLPIMGHVSRFSCDNNKSAHQRLIEKQFPLDKIPQEFILANFNGKIITHPIRLDDLYVVDYEALLDWWRSAKKNLSINFYTGQRVKTISYDFALKNQIDLFIENTELFLQTGIIPKPRVRPITQPNQHAHPGLLLFRNQVAIPNLRSLFNDQTADQTFGLTRRRPEE